MRKCNKGTIFSVIILAMFLVIGCDKGGAKHQDMSKDDAQQQGKADTWDIDYCDIFNWYGDGECDTFCPEADPDCLGQPCDPREERSCGNAMYCIAESVEVEEMGECMLNPDGAVGRGYACGPSIRVLCAEGLECTGLDPYIPGSTGTCDYPEPASCDPEEWKSCGDDMYCVADSVEVDEMGECMPNPNGAVGRGYACGGSIRVVCAEGLECAGLDPDILGSTGTCDYPEPASCDPREWKSCGDDMYCIADSVEVDEMGECMPDPNGAVGRGYACGPSIRVPVSYTHLRAHET